MPGTLMPDPPAALRAAAALVKPGGPIYVTQTFQNRPSPLTARIKPLLRLLTTVDFGVVTYHADVRRIVEQAGLVVDEDEPIPGSIDTKLQTARLLVLSAPTKASRRRARSPSPRGGR